MSAQHTLVRQYRRWLAGAFISLALMLAFLFVGFWVLPMAQRSANNLAGLMVLSAQTWAELPPVTRADFERELRVSHGLELRPKRVDTVQSETHPPFIRLLEKALQQRIPSNPRLEREWRDGQAWYWIHVPVGSGQLAVGLAQSRYDSRPLLILGVGLLISLFMAWGVANWLARRIVAPMQNLSQAMSLVGLGGTPQLLAETGPQEVAALSRHFNAMVHQVRALLGARTTLLAGISHDLRTPLARMRLSLELLRDAPSARYLDHLERDIGHMNQLIGQVLDLARGLESEPHQSVCLPDFLAELADEFDIAQSPSMPNPSSACRVNAPPMALRRALGNLLENALRYAPPDTVVLACEALTVGCRVGVLDRGPGIPEDKMALMLEPFQRLEVSRSPVTGGVGLGLAIVQGLAKANGWQLDMGNRQGGGLQVWLVLPA
jgi:two-component system osmolarity sensor histidine kinase EnvZ